MRISGGRAKGRRITVKGGDIRPTAAKVRESLFNIIGPSISGSLFLDLYAGTGAVGLDAMSRGAGRVVFVEANRLRADLIKKLSVELGFEGSVGVYRIKAFSFLKRAVGEGRRFDYIFIDPPYQSEETMKVLPLIGESNILRREGLVIVEHFSKRVLPEKVGHLQKVKTYLYGDTSLTTYRHS